MTKINISSTNLNQLSIKDGWLTLVNRKPSPHFTPREPHECNSLLVVHNISLPPGKFGGNYICDFFLGCLDVEADEFFKEIAQLRVSAHCVIDRHGEITQFVSFNDKAWHAGISEYNGREKCNDFSIGIELEGTDDIPYTKVQYEQLARLTVLLQQEYPAIENNIVGHCDIAPKRKTDPGKAFNWANYHRCIEQAK